MELVKRYVPRLDTFTHINHIYLSYGTIYTYITMHEYKHVCIQPVVVVAFGAVVVTTGYIGRVNVCGSPLFTCTCTHLNI